jgi:hypothetical protein
MSETGKRSRGGGDQLWDTLTTVTLGLAVLVAIFYVVVFIAPSLSPFGKQEPTRVALLSTPTPKPPIAASPTPIVAPATWTPSPTPNPPTPQKNTEPPPTQNPNPPQLTDAHAYQNPIADDLFHAHADGNGDPDAHSAPLAFQAVGRGSSVHTLPL